MFFCQYNVQISGKVCFKPVLWQFTFNSLPTVCLCFDSLPLLWQSSAVTVFCCCDSLPLTACFCCDRLFLLWQSSAVTLFCFDSLLSLWQLASNSLPPLWQSTFTVTVDLCCDSLPLLWHSSLWQLASNSLLLLWQCAVRDITLIQ